MNDELILLIKAVNGGLFVVGFAVIAELLEPKRFAGLFSAAPSVALASLIVTVTDKGRPDGILSAMGMIAGACALTIVCAVGVAIVPRWGALRASIAMGTLWLPIAIGSYLAFLR
jgi:hypothetical protein